MTANSTGDMSSSVPALALPMPGCRNDCGQIGVMWLPAQGRADFVGGSDQAGGVARATWGNLGGNRAPSDVCCRLNHLAYGVARTIAQIVCRLLLEKKKHTHIRH